MGQPACTACGDPVMVIGIPFCNGCWEAKAQLGMMTPQVMARILRTVLDARKPEDAAEFFRHLGGVYCVMCGDKTDGHRCWNCHDEGKDE